MMKKKSVVLLSSGLDSTVNLFEAREQSEVLLALTFDYGQRAALREQQRAAAICRLVGVPHKVLSLGWFADFTQSSLINRAADVPVKDSVSIDNLSVSHETARAVWVPNRNGIFLNIAAAYAEAMAADWIVPGFNAEEAATFPDNSAAFLAAATSSFAYSTANHVEAICFTTTLSKNEIVARGKTLNVPFSQIWPCYFGDEKPCGQCESCQRFERAMNANGLL
jgi:7-cyano-7-deazaguanine synthase